LSAKVLSLAFSIALLICLPILLCLNQPLLSVWMFLATLQLVSHMALFNTQMP